MPIAHNPNDGTVSYLDETGSWKPAQTAVNPETKEMYAFDGKEWKPVPVSSGTLKALKDALAPNSPPGDMSWLDVAKTAVTNVPSSAVQFGKDLVQPIIHPIETAEAIKNIGAGLLQKVGILSGSDSEKYADAVGKFFMDRYGSEKGIKNAIATDPVGVLADVATVLTGGGAALAKAPGAVGKLGEVVRTAGTAVDPLTAVAATAKATGSAAASVIGGIGTHTGGDSLRQAAKAGYEGGQAGKAFRENLTGSAALDDVVKEAKAAVQQLRDERGQAYRSGIVKVANDKTVLDFADIDQAVQRVSQIKTFKGQDLSPSTQAIRTQIQGEVNAWKALNPADFHTAEGLDALKQKIGDIRDGAAYGTPERAVAEAVYQSIRSTIVAQVPEYAKVMKGYEEASNVLREMERTLSLRPGATIDTALRKLQSVLRNNVNTNYGQRAVLAEYLVNAGAPNLLAKLAGQSLGSLAPRGLGKAVAGLIASGGAGAAIGLGGPGGLAALAALPVTSPFIMGGAAYGIGAAARLTPRPVGQAAFQAGRETRVSR